MNKTNAVRILEANNVNHSIHTYEVDENDLSGVSVARKINADAAEVFKTLVTKSDKNGVYIFCIPVTEELDLKKAAVASSNKKIELVKEKELLPLTGYIRGGCSPIGMKKKYPTFIEETAQIYEKIFISAGIRGMQIYLSPKDLQKITNAVFKGLI